MKMSGMTKKEVASLSSIETTLKILSDDMKIVKGKMLTKENVQLTVSESINSHIRYYHKAVSWSLIGKIIAALAVIIGAVLALQ